MGNKVYVLEVNRKELHRIFWALKELERDWVNHPPEFGDNHERIVEIIQLRQRIAEMLHINL